MVESLDATEDYIKWRNTHMTNETVFYNTYTQIDANEVIEALNEYDGNLSNIFIMYNGTMQHLNKSLTLIRSLNKVEFYKKEVNTWIK